MFLGLQRTLMGPRTLDLRREFIWDNNNQQKNYNKNNKNNKNNKKNNKNNKKKKQKKNSKSNNKNNNNNNNNNNISKYNTTPAVRSKIVSKLIIASCAYYKN